MRHTGSDNENDASSLATELQETRIQYKEHENIIISAVCHGTLDFTYFGKLDGALNVFDNRSGRQDQRLLGHVARGTIEKLIFDEPSSALSSEDNSSHVVQQPMPTF